MVQIGQQPGNPGRLGVVGQHSQVLDLGPDGEVGLVGWLLPFQGNQHIGKAGGLRHHLLDLLLQVLGLAALPERIALHSPSSTGLAGNPQEPAKVLSELAEVPVNAGKFTTILEVAIALPSWNPRPSWRFVFLFFFLFLPLGFSGSSGSSSSEGEADVLDGGSSSEGSQPRLLEL